MARKGTHRVQSTFRDDILGILLEVGEGPEAGAAKREKASN